MLRVLPLLSLVVLAPSAASAPSFPLELSGEYCWSFAGTCRAITWTLFEDGTFEDSFGSGSWERRAGAPRQVILVREFMEYRGVAVGDFCLEGELRSHLGDRGTWWGCP